MGPVNGLREAIPDLSYFQGPLNQPLVIMAAASRHQYISENDLAGAFMRGLKWRPLGLMIPGFIVKGRSNLMQAVYSDHPAVHLQSVPLSSVGLQLSGGNSVNDLFQLFPLERLQQIVEAAILDGLFYELSVVQCRDYYGCHPIALESML